eukprot:1158614-Pelagomonas_calceolata.AAC.4
MNFTISQDDHMCVIIMCACLLVCLLVGVLACLLARGFSSFCLCRGVLDEACAWMHVLVDMRNSEALQIGCPFKVQKSSVTVPVTRTGSAEDG